MAREVVLITGGNQGIGLACSRTLAARGWHVLMASRDRGASERAVEAIRAASGPDAASQLGLDLASRDSIHALVAELAQREIRPAALVCNAGLQFFGQPRFTEDGYELTFAVNHLGHFLLTNLLLERLRASARIVVVSSGVHDPTRWTGMPKPLIDDLETLAATGGAPVGQYDGALAYVNSKLCNLWFTYELARRLEKRGAREGGKRITVNAFDPGLTPGSSLARDYPAPLRFAWDNILPGVARLLSPLLGGINTVDQAGAGLARLVDDPALAGITGKYFPSHTRWRQTPSSPASYDSGRARALWDASSRMAGLDSQTVSVVTGA